LTTSTSSRFWILSDAVASSGCGMPEPTETEVGFRTWSGEGKAIFERTTPS
jgi:hypothetical protein